jgi:23S rRNA (cytidine1920-2'-O)/16S rRNA (cytidine1409-2'-O)-methyltransferase
LKKRLDVLLVEKGFFPSREKAKASVMAGLVYVDEIRVDKAGNMTDPNSVLRVKEPLCPYVSRGGLKLEKAIQSFELDLTNKIAVDMGASTGGFTDCMLKNGASKVYAIDVGYGQLDWKLRNDTRVVNMEKTNIRYLDLNLITEPIDFISIDVSFISLHLILPVAAKMLHPEGQIVCLVKPQFEAGREQVGKGGIVRDKLVHHQVINKVLHYGEEVNLYPSGLTYSPVTGAKGNIEYLLLFHKKERKIVDINYVIGETEHL